MPQSTGTALFTVAAQKAVLDKLLNNVAGTWPATSYLGLATALSGDGASITECVDANYARQAISWAPAAFDAGEGKVGKANDVKIEFPEADAAYTVSHLVVYTASSGGSALAYIANGVVANIGRPVIVDIGKLKFFLPTQFSNAMAAAILDTVFENAAFTAIDEPHLGLAEAGGTEAAFTNYVRAPLDGVMSAGTSAAPSVSANTDTLLLSSAAAGSAGGPYTLAKFFSASSGGTAWLTADLGAAVSVEIGDEPGFAIGDVIVTSN